MNKIMFFILIILFLYPSSVLCGKQPDLEKRTREFAYYSITKILIHSLDKYLSGNYEEAIVAPDGLIVLLADIDSDEAREILLDLVEVYVGSATGEAVTYAIVKQGKDIRDDLELLLSKPVTCSLLEKIRKQTKLKCRSKAERDFQIKQYLKYIDEGVTIQYVP